MSVCCFLVSVEGHEKPFCSSCCFFTLGFWMFHFANVWVLWLSVLGARVGLRVRVAGLGFGVGSGFRVLVTVGVLCIFEYGPDLGRWALGFRVRGVSVSVGSVRFSG